MDASALSVASRMAVDGAAERERRQTRQRAAIRAVFRADRQPLTVAEVLRRAQAAVPALNRATVYRNLGLLVRDGWLVAVAHPEVGMLYERAGLAHHHHFYCRGCAQVYDLPGCPLPSAHRGPEGFVTEGHEVYLRGLCRACAGRRRAR